MKRKIFRSENWTGLKGLPIVTIMTVDRATLPRADSPPLAAMGERARELRREKGLTLQDVATRSGLAISTVSKIERGVMAPTYDRFSRLADGLGVDMAELFSEQGERFKSGEVAVARAGEAGVYQTDTYVYEMLFPELRGRAMVPMLGTLRPFEEVHFSDFIRHEGEEFLIVLDGAVTIRLEDMEAVTLETGDSIYFDSRRGHLYASAGDTEARILVVCTKLKQDKPSTGLDPL